MIWPTRTATQFRVNTRNERNQLANLRLARPDEFIGDVWLDSLAAINWSSRVERFSQSIRS